MTARRHLLLGASALAVGAWSAWIVAHPTDDAVVAAREPATRPARAPAAPDGLRAQAPAPRLAAALPRDRAPAAAPAANAFAPRDWAPPPPPPPVVAAAPPPPPLPPPAPPPPPTLPFRVIGLVEDGLTTTPRVFLVLNDKLLVAAAGDTLEGGFRLDAILAHELVFTHLQRQTELRLRLPGAPT